MEQLLVERRRQASGREEHGMDSREVLKVLHHRRRGRHGLPGRRRRGAGRVRASSPKRVNS